MATINPFVPILRLLSRPNEDPVKTIFIAATVSIAAALFITSSVVLLRPLQEKNRQLDRKRQIAATVAKAIGSNVPLQARIVNLDTGAFAPDIDLSAFDLERAAQDPRASIAIPESADIARLGRRANHAPVYVGKSNGDIDLVVLPISGRGYSSVIRAYLVLRGDLDTVAGLTVYEQGETPGLGSRITEAAWQKQWTGKKITGPSGDIRIRIVQKAASGPHEIDGISGASRTGDGLSNAIRFWLGDMGFGPFLKRVRNESLP